MGFRAFNMNWIFHVDNWIDLFVQVIWGFAEVSELRDWVHDTH